MSAVLEPVDTPRERQVAQLRIPPHSIEAESAVLGAMLLDNQSWDRVGDLLTDSDFYRFEHRLIYAAIGGLVNACRPADMLTVYDVLKLQGKGREVDLSYLNALAQYVPSAANLRRHAEIVREHSMRRKLIAAADEISTAAFNPGERPIDTIVDEAMQRVMQVSPDAADDDWQSMDTLVVEQLDRIQELADNPDNERGNEFVPTGFENMDDLLDGGLRGAQYIVVAARPGMGKTALVDAIGRHIALHEGRPIAKFSLEMRNSEGAQRAIADVGGIPLHALRRPSRMVDADWRGLTFAIDKLRAAQFFSCDKAGLNINQVRAKARALSRRTGKLGLIVVDYFQLMSGVDPRQNRNSQLEEASRGLKNLSKELDCPVIALAQVLRSVEKEGKSWEQQIPRMSDLKDCGSLEQDADIVMSMIRPTEAQPGLADEWKPYARGDVLKQRGGRTGKLHFMWEGKFTRYTAWPIDMKLPTSKIVTGSKSGSDM